MQISDIVWVKHFQKVFDEKHKTYASHGETKKHHYLDALDRKFKQSEVREAIRKLKTGKATGIDGIPAEFFKKLIEEDEILELLTDLLNLIKKTKTWPSSW